MFEYTNKITENNKSSFMVFCEQHNNLYIFYSLIKSLTLSYFSF